MAPNETPTSATAAHDNDPVGLQPGDYIAYPGDEPHVFDALEPTRWL